jgi:hypothetical protein
MEFEKTSKVINIFKEKIIEIILKYKDIINSIEDIQAIDDLEFTTLIKSNIVDSFIMQCKFVN